MKIIDEIELSGFEFWSGAQHNAEMLTTKELDDIGEELEAIYPEGLSETQVNDLFWFDFAYVCELIGLEYDEENDEIRRD